MRILSLDLEGVLIVCAEDFLEPGYLVERGVGEMTFARRGCSDFLRGCDEMFDKIYLNTCVDETTAGEVMGKLGFLDYEYLRVGCSEKISGLRRLIDGNRIVHVEDGIPERDLELARSLGVSYVEVGEYLGYSDCDNELVEALGKIYNI